MRTLSSLQDNGFQGKLGAAGRQHRWAWTALAVVVLVVGGWSVNSLLAESVVYYRTPSEMASGRAGETRVLRLAGSLVAGSVARASGSTTFGVTDGRVTVSVRYDGPPSAALTTGAKPGSQVVAEGTMGPDGVFRAEQLMAKCPSKFTTGG